MNVKNNLRARRTKRKIVSAYLAIINESPDKKVKITDLCNRAGIVRSSFYHYYDSTEDLILDLPAILKEEVKHDGELRPEIAAVHLAETTRRNKPLYCLLYSHSVETMHILQKEIILPVFGLQSTPGKIDVEEVRKIFLANAISGLLYEWVNTPMQYSSKDIGYLIVDCMKASAD